MKKIALAPFMIVAGDHATNDLAGDEEDSWKSLLEAEGYEVRCILKGTRRVSAGEKPPCRAYCGSTVIKSNRVIKAGFIL